MRRGRHAEGQRVESGQGVCGSECPEGCEGPFEGWGREQGVWGGEDVAGGLGSKGEGGCREAQYGGGGEECYIVVHLPIQSSVRESAHILNIHSSSFAK